MSAEEAAAAATEVPAAAEEAEAKPAKAKKAPKEKKEKKPATARKPAAHPPYAEVSKRLLDSISFFFM